MSHATTTSKLDRENPWPGLESYEESGHDYFFGREHDAEKLLDKVLDAPVTVLYGRSGLGKTSLLRAGLFPLLRERDFLPIYVRFELTAGAEPFTRQLHDSVRESIQADVPDAMPPLEDESVWEYLHRAGLVLWSARNYPLTPVIVLDQFEELFTLGERFPDRVDLFRNDLGDLAENRIPPDLAARIKNDESTAGRFNLRSRNYKLLISLREDFLPHLDEWGRLIPALGRSRMRLLRLREAQALEAVHRPAADLMTEELARRVVGIIAGADLHPDCNAASSGVDSSAHRRGVTEVEPALLSLVCRELNEERKRLGQAQFDESLVEEHGRKTLSNYYSSCVHDLRDTVKEFIEDELISEKGFRNFYALEDAVPSRLTDDELTQLISSRLVRLVDYHGAQRIELTHDVLTPAVREHRDRRRAERERAELAARAAELEAEKQRHEAELQLAHERAAAMRKRSRVLATVLAVTVVVSLVAAVLGVVAFKAQHRAEDALHDKEDASHDKVAQSLLSNAQEMLMDVWPGDGSDVRAMQMVLAARSFPSRYQYRDYYALGVVQQERDLIKIAEQPWPTWQVAFRPDGNKIVTANGDGTVRQLDATTLKDQPLEGPPLKVDVRAIAYSPDGTRIASGDLAGDIRLWDAASGHQIGEPLRGHANSVNSVAFSPDGRLLVSGSADKTVRLWDTATGQAVGEPLAGHEQAVSGVAFSPDGQTIVSGSPDKTIRIWDARSGHQIGEPIRGHEAAVDSVAFSPDGQTIVSGSDDKTIRIWDARSRRQIGDMRGHDNGVLSVAFSPDGARIASGSADRTIRIWDVASRRQVGILTGHRSAVNSVAFHPDNRRLVSAGSDNTVRVWDTVSWQPIAAESGEDAVAGFVDGGRTIGMGEGGDDPTVHFWDTATAREVGQPIHVPDRNVEWLGAVDRHRLVSEDSTNTVRFWDASSGLMIGRPIPIRDNDGWQRYTYRLETRLRRIVLARPDGTLEVRDVATMHRVGQPIRPEMGYRTFVLSPDGRVVVTGHGDWTVRLWDVDTGKPIGSPMENSGWIDQVAFSDDGRLLAVSDIATGVRVWDTRTQKQVGSTFKGDAVMNSLAFSPDGTILAAGGDDGHIQVWDIASGVQFGPAWVGHRDWVTSLDFSPDGTRLLSASADGTVRVWPIPQRSQSPEEALCAKLTQNMSREDWDSWVAPDIPYKELCPDLPDR